MVPDSTMYAAQEKASPHRELCSTRACTDRYISYARGILVEKGEALAGPFDGQRFVKVCVIDCRKVHIRHRRKPSHFLPRRHLDQYIQSKLVGIRVRIRKGHEIDGE